MGRYFNNTAGPLPIELSPEHSVCPRGYSEFAVRPELRGSPELSRLISIGMVRAVAEAESVQAPLPVVAQTSMKVVEIPTTQPLVEEKTTSDASRGARPMKNRR